MQVCRGFHWIAQNFSKIRSQGYVYFCHDFLYKFYLTNHLQIFLHLDNYCTVQQLSLHLKKHVIQAVLGLLQYNGVKSQFRIFKLFSPLLKHHCKIVAKFSQTCATICFHIIQSIKYTGLIQNYFGRTTSIGVQIFSSHAFFKGFRIGAPSLFLMVKRSTPATPYSLTTSALISWMD